jgi:hypothetical protein
VPPLKALTRLVELRLDFSAKYYVSTDALSTLEHLTILALAAETDYMVYLEGAGLAGMTNLRILDLASCIGTGVSISPGRCGGYGDEYILQYLPQLQQLRHLHMHGSLHDQSPYSTMTAAAYSALTSSSALQSLSLTNCKVPPGVWQHMFSTGKQMTSLTSLDLDGVVQRSEGLQPEGGRQVVYLLAAAPTGTCLASCCPSLQIVNMHNLECTAEGLASLQGLGSLRQLVVQPAMPADSQSDLKVFQAQCQLTQLRCLVLYDKVPEGLLPLQLTQLQGLTVLAITPRLLAKGYDGQDLNVRQVRTIGYPTCPYVRACPGTLASATACLLRFSANEKYYHRECLRNMCACALMLCWTL